MLRVSRLCIVVALALSIGLHWALLQSVAWVGMVVSYSQAAPLAEALTKTFDGQHPCALCKKISEGKQAEKQSDTLLLLKKLDGVNQRCAFVFAAPQHFWLLAKSDLHYTPSRPSPPVPPPRGIAI